ncbi:MAG: hypothetical protein RLZZ230_449 [Candidatus Parcubacteria bacterium]
MFVLALFIIPTISLAAIPTNCDFTRTIEDGVDGADVLCLQKYLNASGFKIAETGPGAPGQETTLYRALTKEAVIKWQKAKGLTPAIGMFAGQSKAAYLKDVLAQKENKKTDQVVATVTTPTSPLPQVAGVATVAKSEAQKETEKAIIAALQKIVSTYGDLETLRVDNPKKAVSADQDARDALDTLFNSLKSYFNGDFAKAKTSAVSALGAKTSSRAVSTTDATESKTKKTLDGVENLYDEVDGLLSDAEDDDADVGDAPDLFEEAGGLLDDAWDSFDAGVYRQATSDALDAEELLNAALKEFNVVTQSDAKKALKKAHSSVSDAWDEVDNSDASSKSISKAEAYLDKADSYLDDADSSYDDEDYTGMMKLVDKADGAVGDALDEI